MRVIPLILTSLFLFVNGCGPARSNPTSVGTTLTPNTTGFSNEQGFAYTTNGDTRIDQSLLLNQLIENEDPIPTQTAPPQTKVQAVDIQQQQQPQQAAKPLAPEVVRLRTRVRDIEITRVGVNSNSPMRFGTAHATIRIFFTDQEPVTFQARLSQNRTHSRVEADAGGYTLSGTIEDNAPVETLGDFTLIKTSQPDDIAQLLYRAYRAQLSVTPQDKTVMTTSPQSAAKAMSELGKDSFGWVHNWAIVGGRSFYLVDLIKIQRVKDGKSLAKPTATSVIRLKGESLSTIEQGQPVQVAASKIEATARLVQNDDTKSKRVFEVAVKEPQSTQESHYDVTVEAEDSVKMPSSPISHNPAPPVETTAPRLPKAPTIQDVPHLSTTPDKTPVRLVPVTKPPAVKVPVTTKTPNQPATPKPTQSSVAPSQSARPTPRPKDLNVPRPVAPTRSATGPIVEKINGDGVYLYVNAVDTKGRTRGELLTQGMCYAQTRNSVQVQKGYCASLWRTLSQPGPSKTILDRIHSPTDINNYCPNYAELKSNPTKKALVFMALMSAVAQQESGWRPGVRHGIYQMSSRDGKNYPDGCRGLSVNDAHSNIRCGTYIAMYNLARGNRISAQKLSTLAMSHYYGSVQQGRAEQQKIAAKVKSYCQALGRTAL